MKKLLFCLTILTIFLFTCFGCSTDDKDLLDSSFLEGALTAANEEDLQGRWTILQIEFEDQISDVFPSLEECGRDFFEFQLNETYMDYVFENSDCIPENNMLSWSLSNGVITLSNGTETDLWVITQLTSDLLVFKFQFNSNSDGQPERYKAICNRYEPPIELDI